MRKREPSGLRLAGAWLVLFALGSAGAWYLTRPAHTEPGEPDAPQVDIEGVTDVVAATGVGSQPVVGARVVRDTLHLQVVAAGVAEASRESRLSTRTAGVVQQVFVREGEIRSWTAWMDPSA